MKKQLRGYIKFTVRGKKIYSFINALHKSHICCFGQYCKGDIFYGEIYAKSLTTVAELAKKFSLDLNSTECKTLRKKLSRYNKRFGFVFGLIVVIFCCIYFSNSIMVIEINGNSSVKSSVILSVLDELGVKKGAFIGDINFASCERQLRLRVDKVSWAGIRHTGNRVVVDITEIVDAPEMLHERIPCNIIADRSAQIISTSVYDGQLMRIVGDYVRQGDIIVSGIITDSTGHLTKHHALADIKGIYQETVTFSQPYEVISKSATGRTKKENSIDIFNIDIPLFIKKNKFQNFSVSENCCNYKLFGKTLPIAVKKRVISENTSTSTKISYEEAKKIINEKSFLYEKNFLDDVKILEESSNESKNDNTLNITVTYTVEGSIGVNHDIYFK